MKTAAQLIAFEDKIKGLWESGDLPFLLHLSGGNEEQLISLFKEVRAGDWIFSTHRSHYHALLSGVPPRRVEQLIRDGRSMFIFDRKHNFLTSSILAGTCCIAAGVAWQLKHEGSNRVWCFLGDGAADEGHFFEAVNMVQGHGLPCTFVLEDNDRSVDTDKATRRGTYSPVWPSCVRSYTYTPTWPHAGSGCKHQITFKPYTPKET